MIPNCSGGAFAVPFASTDFSSCGSLASTYEGFGFTDLRFRRPSPLFYLTLLLLSYFFSLTPDSLFLKTSLSISPKVPSVLHHHAVALGSFPKFRILSPDEIRISVWNHTVDSFVVRGNVYLPILGFCCGSLQTLSGSAC